MSLQGNVMQAPDYMANPKVNIQIDEKASQLHLAPVELKAPVYKLRKFTQISGGNTLTLSTSPTQSIFNIPGNGVWNFARSYFTLDALFAAQAANANLNVAYADCLPVDSIQLLYDGRVLTELTSAQIYTKAAHHMATDLQDYLTRSSVYGPAAVGNTYPLGQIVGCQPANACANLLAVRAAGGAADTTASLLQYDRLTGAYSTNLPSEATLVDSGAAPQVITVSAFPASNVSGSDIVYRGAPQRLVCGTANAPMGVRYRINLRAFVGTILAMDKDLFFGQNLQLVVNWADFRQWGYTADIDNTNVAELAAAPTITKYQLYMAEDINEENRVILMSQVRGAGLNILTPYTYCKPITIAAASTSGTNSQPLTKGMGLALKRCLTVPVIANATLNARNNTFNVGGVKFTNIQSTLDGKPLQDQKLVLADSDVWNYMRDMIRRSPAGLSQRTYEENCFFLDNFSDCYDSTHFYENDTKCSGLEIDLPQKTYEVNIEKAAGGAISLIQYQTWVKLLVIRPDGIMWGSTTGSMTPV